MPKTYKEKEEAVKNKVGNLYFRDFDCTNILGNIDFSVAEKNDTLGLFNDIFDRQYFLWAEAKRDNTTSIEDMFVQLILTIGISKFIKHVIPPMFLGIFNDEEISFIPYEQTQFIFSMNDFDWSKVKTPSNYESEMFKKAKAILADYISKDKRFNFHFRNSDTDEIDIGVDKELKKFIAKNFKTNLKSKELGIEINKSNFISVYSRWLKEVKDTIALDWNTARTKNVFDTDFYLADLLSKNNEAIKDDLFVTLHNDHYCFNRKKTELGEQSFTVSFKDKGKAHSSFWMRYKRPPEASRCAYILDHRDLLVPQDVREIKGAYFTPQIWVEKSQEYLASVLGENWQNEYYIWDCCAGTGNMENGLTNKYRIWASTIDQADVDVMKDRIKNGANLLESHVFQMDFLNDEFADKCPQDLLDILNDPEKRKKLIIYINPPYKEATTATTVTGNGQNRSNVATSNRTYSLYKNELGKSSNELFAQFFMRIYKEIPDCILGEFSTLKILQAGNFKKFREVFLAELKNMFVVPADTFDNVDGQFPIGFMIWDTSRKERFKQFSSDVYDKNGDKLLKKTFLSLDEFKETINRWIKQFDIKKDAIGYMENPAPDFQNNKFLNISTNKGTRHVNYIFANDKNLIPTCIYFAVRLCLKHFWLYDRDQYLCPTDNWKADKEFQTNCLTYTLFHGQNRVQSKYGINKWIPFTEQDVDAKSNFQSNFMTDYFKENKLQFSEEAQAVFDAARDLWKYYHSMPDANPNASYYDIRLYFQGTNEKGDMNKKSTDEHYNILLSALKNSMSVLEAHIVPKVYEYGFLLK